MTIENEETEAGTPELLLGIVFILAIACAFIWGLFWLFGDTSDKARVQNCIALKIEKTPADQFYVRSKHAWGALYSEVGRADNVVISHISAAPETYEGTFHVMRFTYDGKAETVGCLT